MNTRGQLCVSGSYRRIPRRLSATVGADLRRRTSKGTLNCASRGSALVGLDRWASRYRSAPPASKSLPSDTMAQLGIHLHDNELPQQPDQDHALGDVIIRNNKIRYVDGLAEEDSTGSGIEVNGAKNLLLRENLVEVLSANPICHQRCGSVNYFNNRTADGRLLPKYDDSEQRWVEELDAQAEDAFILTFLKP